MASGRNKSLDRRNFLRNSSIGLLGAGLISKDVYSDIESKTEDKLTKIKEYRILGRTGFKVSDIGRGAITNNEAVLKSLLTKGVNYIDTAVGYGNGNDERMIGKCIQEFDRKSLFITTKVRHDKDFKTKEDILNKARDSLERLQTDYLDCLMIHAAQTVEIINNEAFHNAISQLKSEGRVRFCGVSCHGSSGLITTSIDTMEEILLAAVKDGRFDVLLLAYNFFKQDMGKKIMEACKEKNIGTTIMKTTPYINYLRAQEWIENFKKEGRPIPEWLKRWLALRKGLKEQAESFIKEHNLTSSDEIRNASISFVLDNPNVNCVLLKFHNFDDIENNLRLSGTRLSSSDKKTLNDYEGAFGQFYCRHACGLCESKCPHNIPVNTIMRYDQYFHAQKLEKYAMEKYSQLPGAKADLCEDCEGFCESSCPYKVPIQGLLNIAHRKLTLA